MTLALTDVLLAIIAAAAVAGAIMLFRVAGQIIRMAAEVEQAARHLNYLQPRIERVLEQAENELVEARKLTDKANTIATDLEALSEQTRKGLLPALQGITAIAGPLQYLGAAIAGAKIGMKVLGKKHRKTEDDD